MKIDASGNIGKLALANNKINKTETSFAEILNKAEKGQDDDKKLMEVCQQLESVFVHQMISQMRATIPEGGLIPKSQGEKIFEDMLDEKYAQNISKAGGMGLAKILYDQLSQKTTSIIDNRNKED